MSVWSQLFTFDDLGTKFPKPPVVEICVEAHDTGNVVLFMEKQKADDSSDFIAEITENEAFELAVAIIHASSSARKARLHKMFEGFH